MSSPPKQQKVGTFKCWLFGHKYQEHLHRETNVISCSGGCEKYECVKILPCVRCGKNYD